MNPVQNMKNCSKCSTTKPLFMFDKQTTAKDGLQSYCKPCHNTNASVYRQKITKIEKASFLTKLAEIPQLKLPDIDYE